MTKTFILSNITSINHHDYQPKSIKQMREREIADRASKYMLIVVVVEETPYKHWQQQNHRFGSQDNNHRHVTG